MSTLNASFLSVSLQLHNFYRRHRLVSLLGAALLLSGCGVVAPSETDFADTASLMSYVCGALAAIIPIIVVLSLFFAVIGITLMALARFASGVLPGGILSFAQNNTQNVLMGTLFLFLGPMIVMGLFRPLLESFGASSCDLSAG